jgi:phage N-6-adenine-methyltransferase
VNRKTRDKFAQRTSQKDLTAGSACWETPPLLYAAIEARYGPFELDLFADSARHLTDTWFGPGSPMGEEDALIADWLAYGRSGFGNPPYGRFIVYALDKAKRAAERGFYSVLLLPFRVTRAFHEFVLDGASELVFMDRRITFFEHGTPRINQALWEKKGKLVADCAMFDSMLVRFCPSPGPLMVSSFAVPKHVTKDDLERAVENVKQQAV